MSEKTFVRYENGQATQSYAMDDLLRILREFPETIRVVSSSSSSRQRPQEESEKTREATYML